MSRMYRYIDKADNRCDYGSILVKVPGTDKLTESFQWYSLFRLVLGKINTYRRDEQGNSDPQGGYIYLLLSRVQEIKEEVEHGRDTGEESQ